MTITQPELDICKTVINLSTLQLSQEQTKVLAKGLNFAVAPTRIPKEEIITQVECVIPRLLAEEAEEIQHGTCRILQKAKPPARNIAKEERKALENMRRNQNLIVVRADR
ncbi:putative Rab GTPase-activating protein 1-like [Trypoxylus dichotomus]